MTDNNITEFEIHVDPEKLKSWLALRKRVLSKRTEISKPGYRQSRRVEGMMDHSGPANGYNQVFVYIQKGLGASSIVISRIIRDVYSAMDTETRFRLYLAVFDGLELSVRPRPYFTYGFKSDIIKALEDLAGNTRSTPGRFYNFAIQHRIKKLDLVLIFVAGLKDVRFSEEAMQTLSKHKNSYLIEIAEEPRGEASCHIKFNKQE